MKNRILFTLMSALAVVSLFGALAPATVSAADPAPDGHNHLLVKLSGTNGRTGYQVTANSYTLNYDSGRGGFYSPALPGTGSPCTGPAAASLTAQNSFKITVKYQGGNAGSGSYNFCGKGVGFIQTVSVGVTAGSSTKPASVTGCINYNDDNGDKKPFQSEATGTLKGPGGKSYALKFHDNGCIETIKDLPPGSYTVNADYAVPGGQNQNYTKTFTLKAGQTYSFNGAIAGNVVKKGNGEDPNDKGDDSTDNSKLSCGISNPLNFIICPAVDLLTSIINSLDTIITDQLAIGSTKGHGDNQPDAIFCTDKAACKAYKQAWSQFRNIALGLMAIAGLVILISQAMGFELLDAYTIRKTLPRLLIAALGITLSWQLMQFFITLTNDIGYGVRGLIYSPFSSLGKNEFDLSFGGLGITALLGGVGYLTVGALGLFLLACSGALAVFVAILVLILRQIAVTMMLILAPIAIVAYVLPNTQRVYKFWWESFSKALLMFPLIEAFIATGRVFAVLAFNNSNGTGDFNQIIGFIAYFAPYFLIPATFKLAGGALRQIGGFVNDRSRGGFDFLRKKRQENMGRRVSAARTGGIYRPDFGQFGNKGRSVGKLLNSFGNATLDFPDTAAYHAGRKGSPLRPLLGRKSDILGEKIAKQTLAHSQKAAQDLDLHYQAGRALGGQFQYFTKGLDADSVMELNNKYGVKDADGTISSWRAPTGKNEVEDIANILSRGDAGAREASQELIGKAGALGSLRGPGKEETQRADLATIGLMAAAQQGRLENEDIVLADRALRATHPSDTVSQTMASMRTAQLQTIASQKRTSQARGHGIEYVRDGNGTLQAVSVYANPTSDKAQNSLMRMSTQDVAASKSEDLDETRETWLAGISEYKLQTNANGTLKMAADGSPMPEFDKSGNAVRKEGKELERAAQLKERMRSIAMYNQGDSDVGRKIKSIYDAAGHDTSELSWGSRAGDERERELIAGAAKPEPEPTPDKPA